MKKPELEALAASLQRKQVIPKQVEGQFPHLVDVAAGDWSESLAQNHHVQFLSRQ
jgi:hypothetical protein